MGRPLNKRYFGSGTGKLQFEADLGSGTVTNAYVVRQTGTRTFWLTDGTDTALCTMQAGAPAAPGECRMFVRPMGSSGAGATGVSRLGGNTGVIAAAGTTYIPAQTITLTGGTFTSAAVMTVATTKVVSATVAAGGASGTPGTQTVTGTTGTGTKFTASVTVSGGGAVTAVLSILTGGSYTVNPTSLTNEPVTGASLVGAQLNVVMGVNTATVTTPGVYSVLPANPVAQGSTSGSGTGATFTMNWKVVAVNVTAGGSGYTSAVVAFTGGGGTLAAATATVTTGSVSSVAIGTAGSGYTSLPTVAITPTDSPKWASDIMTWRVRTTDGNQYKWVSDGTTPTEGQAEIDLQ